MKKRLFMFATAALMLAACSNDGEVAVNDGATQLQSGSGVVAFDTYTSSATKAGQAGVMTTSAMQGTGFGVFATWSNDEPYAPSFGPNFMYNQEVTYSDGAWTYSPLKYWPNETNLDRQTSAATSANTDRLSFFAYAPFVDVDDAAKGELDGVTYSEDPTKADAKTSEVGIQAIVKNTETTDDPWVRYKVATTPSESVDLLWGVAPSGGLQYQSVNPTDNSTYNINIAEGMPLVNLVKPAKDQKIKFLFQHALARLGLTIVAAFDQVAPGGKQDANTKIAVKSVAITETTADKVLFTQGALNLKNTTAFKSLWQNTSGAINFEVSGTTLNPAIAWKSTAGDTYTDDDIKGVTTTEQKVIAQTGSPAHDNYFMVIPTHEDAELQVVITYDVITADPNLNGSYSVVENVITKKVTVSKLTNNKAYNLKLILGMTSVKLEAEVADWQVDGSNEVYLPQNAE